MDFAPLNSLLRRYDDLDFDPKTKKAITPATETEVSRLLWELLVPLIRRLVWRQLPPFDAQRRPPGERLEEALGAIYEVLFTSLRARRASARGPLVVTAEGYFEYLVRRALLPRGLRPVQRLNRSIHHCRELEQRVSLGEWDLLLELVREELAKCCLALLRSRQRNAAEQPGDEQVATAVATLLERFATGELWGNRIVPEHALPETWEAALAEMQIVPGRPEYVDESGFAREVAPLLWPALQRPDERAARREPRPRADERLDAFDQFLDDKRDALRTAVDAAYQTPPADDDSVLRLWAVLLFLPYAQTERTFGDDFDCDGKARTRFKQIWAERLARPVADALAQPHQYRELMIRLVRKANVFGWLVDSLLVLRWLRCQRTAWQALLTNPEQGRQFLYQVWQFGSGRADRLDTPGGVQHREVSGPAPDGYRSYKQHGSGHELEPTPSGAVHHAD